jgi:hypothetical protein
MDTRYWYMALREWVEQPITMGFKDGQAERERRAKLPVSSLTCSELSTILYRAQYLKDEDRNK